MIEFLAGCIIFAAGTAFGCWLMWPERPPPMIDSGDFDLGRGA